MLPGAYRIDETGSFTDTANYVDLIGECTNISVGYSGAHSPDEKQSIRHALALRESLLRFDESRLVAQRAPGERESVESWGYDWRFGGAGQWRPSLADYIRDNAESVADVLEGYGIDVAELESQIASYK
jgi:hypothetical protein